MSAMKTFLIMLGHGRALEMYLIGAKFQIGFMLLFTEPQVVALKDLYWVTDFWLGVPFLLLAAIQLVGIILNLLGFESSHVWRSVGASIGIVLWCWLISKSLLIGVVATGGFPFWNMSFLASLLLLWRGLNRLPVPGAPGGI